VKQSGPVVCRLRHRTGAVVFRRTTHPSHEAAVIWQASALMMCTGCKLVQSFGCTRIAGGAFAPARWSRKCPTLDPAPSLFPRSTRAFGPHLGVRLQRCRAGAGSHRLRQPSGALRIASDDLEDGPGPFVPAHAPFKVWAPLWTYRTGFVYFEPGSRPQLLFHSPPITHKPAALREAIGPVTSIFAALLSATRRERTSEESGYYRLIGRCVSKS